MFCCNFFLWVISNSRWIGAGPMAIEPGGCAIQDISPKFILNPNFTKSRPPTTPVSVVESLLHVAKHGNNTAVPCTKFQNDWVTEKSVMSKRIFTRFGIEMRFSLISYIAPPFSTSNTNKLQQSVRCSYMKRKCGMLFCD